MKITKGLLASLIIIIISGLAFTAGFLKERVVNEIEETKITIANDEALVEKIDDKISDILIIDHLTLLESRNEIQTAKHLAMEWDLTYDNSTVIERNLLTGQIRNSINTYEQLVRNSYVGNMVHHFKRFGFEDDYFLANSNFDGFNYSISKVKFDEYDSDYSLSELMTIDLFLEEYAFKNATELAALWTYPSTEDRTIIEGLDLWTNLFRDELYIIQQQLNNYANDLASLESVVSYYSYGVTIITITTILATAMTVQLNDKEREKEFSHIKAKIYNDESMIVTKMNRIAMPVLFVALTLSILALIVPLLIGLIT